MITSTANQQVKQLIQLNKKRKLRDERGVFVAEGFKMFREAPRERIEKVYSGLDANWYSRSGSSQRSEFALDSKYHKNKKCQEGRK